MSTLIARVIKQTNKANMYFNETQTLFQPGIHFQRFPFLALNTKYIDTDLTVGRKPYLFILFSYYM